MSGNKACKKMLCLELKASMHNSQKMGTHAKKKKIKREDLDVLMPVSSKQKKWASVRLRAF